MNYKYKIPRYVDKGMSFYNGDWKGLVFFLPCLILSIILFLASHQLMFKIFIPTVLIGASLVLTTQKINRETYIEILSNKIRHQLQVKKLVWEPDEN